MSTALSLLFFLKTQRSGRGVKSALPAALGSCHKVVAMINAKIEVKKLY